MHGKWGLLFDDLRISVHWASFEVLRCCCVRSPQAMFQCCTCPCTAWSGDALLYLAVPWAALPGCRPHLLLCLSLGLVWLVRSHLSGCLVLFCLSPPLPLLYLKCLIHKLVLMAIWQFEVQAACRDASIDVCRTSLLHDKMQNIVLRKVVTTVMR